MILDSQSTKQEERYNRLIISKPQLLLKEFFMPQIGRNKVTIFTLSSIYDSLAILIVDESGIIYVLGITVFYQVVEEYYTFIPLYHESSFMKYF